MADSNDRVSRFMAEFGPRPDVESRRVLSEVRKRMLGASTETRVSRYERLERLGHGGMGVVYRAFDPLLKRRVAIKILHPAAGAEGRILEEAQALARFSHPNIVGILDTGREGEEVFVVMEYVGGETLADVLSRRPSLSEFMPLLEQAVAGLEAAHERSLVHHDVKPSNILISRMGTVRVADFGLARLMQEGARPIGGTRGFAAPEQLAGEPCDTRADVYSMTALVYAATFGHPPPEHDAAALPTGSKVSARLQRFLRKGLASDPSQRQSTLRGWWMDLRAATRPRWPRVAGSLAALGLVGAIPLGLSFGTEPVPCADARLFPWTPQSRARVRERLDSMQIPFAADVYRRVDTQLSDRGRRWRRVREQACATHDRAAIACLDAQRAGAAEMVDWLSTLGPDELERVEKGLSSLPAPEQCADAERAPSSPKLERLDEDLARARALVSTGRYGEALALLEQVELPTDTRLHASRLATHAATGARAFELAGDYDAAAAAFERAYLHQLLADADGSAAREASRLAGLLASKLGDPVSARRWLRNGEAALSRASMLPPGARADIATTRAQTLFRLGDIEAALEAHDRADALLPPTDPRRADLSVVLGSIRDHQGDMDAAVKAQRRALAIMRETLGESHPRVLGTQSNLALALLELGELDEAERLFRQVLRRLDEMPGLHPYTRVVALFNLANLRGLQGRTEEAVALYEQSLEIQEELFGFDHPTVAATLTNLANKLRALGRYEEALAMQHRALQIREAKLGPEHPDLIWTLLGLSNCYQAAGKPARALPHIERAYELGKDADVDPLLVAGVKFELAQAIHSTGGDHSRALKLTREALEPFRATERRPKDRENIETFLASLERFEP